MYVKIIDEVGSVFGYLNELQEFINTSNYESQPIEREINLSDYLDNKFRILLYNAPFSREIEPELLDWKNFDKRFKHILQLNGMRQVGKTS